MTYKKYSKILEFKSVDDVNKYLELVDGEVTAIHYWEGTWIDYWFRVAITGYHDRKE